MQSKLPIVSVIMPVFNGASTIKLALNSLFCQTYIHWQCVIVNDGSTDETKVILDQLIDPRFKIVHLSQNIGRGAARQIALDNSTGDYLTYLDADDFYHEDKLKKEVDILISNSEIALVSCGQGSYDQIKKLIAVRGNKIWDLIPFKFGDTLQFVPVTSMIRLTDTKKIKYNPKLNASEDVDYFSNYLDGKTYSVIDGVYYYYYEFESATYKKILEYNKYEFIRTISMIKRIKIKAIKLAFIVAIKFSIFALAIPFLGVNFFLKRRGRIPTEQESKNFIIQYQLSLKHKI